MRRIILMLLCSVGMWGCGTARRYLGPTVHGYSFHASTVPNRNVCEVADAVIEAEQCTPYSRQADTDLRCLHTSISEECRC
jgi:hypothetical protein